MTLDTSIYLHVPFCTHRCAYCDFNTYAGQEDSIPAYVRALVSEIPGTTRDVLRESMDIGGVPALLVDTAGLNPGTADALELAGMERSRLEIAAADAVVLVMDSSAASASGEGALAQMVAHDYSALGIEDVESANRQIVSIVTIKDVGHAMK